MNITSTLSSTTTAAKAGFIRAEAPAPKPAASAPAAIVDISAAARQTLSPVLHQTPLNTIWGSAPSR